MLSVYNKLLTKTGYIWPFFKTITIHYLQMLIIYNGTKTYSLHDNTLHVVVVF